MADYNFKMQSESTTHTFCQWVQTYGNIFLGFCDSKIMFWNHNTLGKFLFIECTLIWSTIILIADKNWGVNGK